MEREIFEIKYKEDAVTRQGLLGRFFRSINRSSARK